MASKKKAPKKAAKSTKTAATKTKTAKPAKKAAPKSTAKKSASTAKTAKAAKATKTAAKKSAKTADKTVKPPFVTSAEAKAKSTKTKKPAATKKSAKASAEIMVSVTMWEPVLPLDRGDRYEDPLFEALEDAGLGGAGDGGGTLQGRNGEIEQIDFDVTISTLDAIPVVTKHLEAAGAPKGSVLRYEVDGEDVEVMFGASEAIAVYLDGITQPAEVYQSTSAQELVDRVLAAAPQIQLRGSWQGPQETALYFYGSDADALWPVVEPVLRDYPLSRNARVILRHGNPINNPREVRLA